ncbi:LysR family transcriptional regulator [Marinimicrococcus flavescens]|uniref:LysR family transcriptional regulator n=1 Tax=Marinimicrococcus flavescens TaxID=3031815 RepID=A0AAP4D509_9PROT|nr:LysR family transcriptional regulator [Marinimicrococcus flavescens]
MSVTQLRAFHLVAAAGGYSQAAREMAVSQSTLSAHVRQLEAASGLALFERKPRGVVLTPDGEALYQVTSRLFTALAEARIILKREAADGGRLRVAADGAGHCLPILSALRQRRPNLVFSLQVLNSGAVIEQLLDYRADAGITAQAPSNERIYSRPLTSMRVGAFVPKEHSWARRGRLRMKDLEGCAFVLRERGSRTRAVFEQNLERHDVTLGPVLEVSTREGVREAVAAGFGVGVTADLEFGFDARLRYLPISDATETIDEFVVCLEERKRVPIIAEFFACAEAVILPSGHERTDPSEA